MYTCYANKGEISKNTIIEVKEYYDKLFNNYEFKTISEISEDLDINPKTLRLYLKALYTGKNCDGKYSKISLQILLCTKFVSNSPYYDDQQELMDVIKRRQIVKELKNNSNHTKERGVKNV